MNNIWKLCKGGQWYNDTDSERYEHICQKLELYLTGIDDFRDLTWHLKDALIGEVHISCSAMSLVLPNRLDMPKKYRGVFDELVNNGKVDHKGLDIHRLCGWWNKSCSDPNSKLVCEHVVPTVVYLDYVIQKITNHTHDDLIPEKKYTIQYIKSRFSLCDFLDLRSKLNMCIITKIEEDNRLNKKGLKNKMPSGCNFPCCHPFVRYSHVGIIVYP